MGIFLKLILEQKNILIGIIALIYLSQNTNHLFNGNMKIAINLIDNVDSLFRNLKIVINCLFNPTSSNWQTFINKMTNLKRTNKCEINYFFRKENQKK